MESPHSPQTQVHEGACAIKVSMKSNGVSLRLIYPQICARTIIVSREYGIICLLLYYVKSMIVSSREKTALMF
jgi:hypothetical protein